MWDTADALDAIQKPMGAAERAKLRDVLTQVQAMREIPDYLKQLRLPANLTTTQVGTRLSNRVNNVLICRFMRINEYLHHLPSIGENCVC